MNKIITIFGSAFPIENDPEYKIAFGLGKVLGQNGFTICNGGYGGIMEASARGAKEGGGFTIGVITDFYKKNANRWIDESIVMPTMVDRLLRLIEKGDGYVVLRGGTGTLMELSAVWEFVNKGIMRKKPIVLLGYFWESVVKTVNMELVLRSPSDSTYPIFMAEHIEECSHILLRELS